MANTRQSLKRSRQEKRRQEVNRRNLGKTKAAVKLAIEAITKKDKKNGPAAYRLAVKSLATAARKGTIPARRASRKTSRITLLAKKTFPDALKAPTASK